MCFLTVHTPNGIAHTFKGDSSCAVEKLKAMIQEKTGMPERYQNIIAADSVLMNDDTVVVHSSQVSLIIGEIQKLFTINIGAHTVILNVPFHFFVFDLFSLIQRHLSYNITHFSLYEDGEVLGNDLSVSAIEKAELVLLRPLKKGEILIFITTLTGRKIPLIVTGDMKVDELKQLVCDYYGFPADQQRFIFAAQQLEDQKSLSDYALSDGDCLSLVLRIRGGMFHVTSTGKVVSSLHGDDVSSLHMFYPKKTLTVNHGNRTVFLRVETFFSLEQVKVLLQEELGIPMENMTLHNDAGLELENERALGYYGIELGATLRMSVA
jgi:hypothetical protein